MWPSLVDLHSMVHLSLSLQPISSTFSIDPDYLQSLMLLVALVLAMGFGILVLLALFLCLVISCLQPTSWPINWPPTSARLVVIGGACALALCASMSVAGNQRFATGLDALVNATGELGELSEQLKNATEPLQHQTARVLAHSAAAFEACLQCVGNLTDVATDVAYPSHQLAARQLSKHHHPPPPPPVAPNAPNVSVDCDALRRGAQRVALSGASLAGNASEAGRPIDSVIHVLSTTTGWHPWAATLPLFALTCVSVAVILGTVLGKRNLLVLAQFFSVIVWWMMCAVVSVEFAISVGMADACVDDPVKTMLRVLRSVAAGNKAEPRPDQLWMFNLTAHLVSDCSYTDPLTVLVDDARAGLALINQTLAALDGADTCSPRVGADPRFDALLVAQSEVRAALPGALAPLGACGPHGPVGSLFEQGVTRGLCGDAADGLVEVFTYQAYCGLLLLILTLLLPVLWHSHYFPPMSCQRPTMMRRLAPLHEMSERSSEADTDDPALQPLDAALVDASTTSATREISMRTVPSLDGSCEEGDRHGGGSEPSSSGAGAAAESADRAEAGAGCCEMRSGSLTPPEESTGLPRQCSVSSDISSHDVL